jgi:phage gpG-like protein
MQRKMATLGGMVQNTIEESFDKEASPFGERWKPLSSVTAKARFKGKTHTKKGANTKGFLRAFGVKQSGAKGRSILVRDGHLSNSFTVHATSQSVTIGTNKKYAAIHQFGGMAGRGKTVNIQARPFLPISKNGELKDSLVEDIKDFLKKSIFTVLE